MTTLASARRRGSRFAKAVRDYLREQGWDRAHLTDLAGANDIGDIDEAWPDHVIQAKATSSESLGATITATERQLRKAGRRYLAIVRWRRSHGVAKAYVTVPLWQYDEMQQLLWLREYEYGVEL